MDNLMPHFETVLSEALQLSPLDKVRLVERLMITLEMDVQKPDERQAEWEQFIERTAGSLADDPIMRLPEGDFEIRDEIQ